MTIVHRLSIPPTAAQAIDRGLSTIDTAYCGTGYRPWTIDYRPSTIDHRPSTIDYRLSTIDYRLSTVPNKNYLYHVKLTATFLLCFMFASSFGATCSDGCCEDEHAHEEYEWVWQVAKDHHEVETCTPFCGCNCCQTLIEHGAFNQPEIKACRPTTTFLSGQPPSLPEYDIWQPPKY